jgi:2-phosphinomethylmalic acid synthase
VPALLGRPLEVSLTKESGLAGLIFLIRQHLGVELSKEDPRLHAIHAWVEGEWESGRQTSIEWEELAPVAERAMSSELRAERPPFESGGATL